MEFPEFTFDKKSQDSSFEESRQDQEHRSSDDEEQNKKSYHKDNRFSINNCDNYDLVIRDFQLQPITLQRYKTVKSFEFFQLQCDCLFDIEYFEGPYNQNAWLEKQDSLQSIRPVRKIYRFKKFRAYELDTSSNGIVDFEMPIRRLIDTQNQQAYNLAKVLQKAQLQFNQFNEMNKRLKSIFTVEYLREKLSQNYEQSLEMAKKISVQLTKGDTEFFSVLIVRICPETMIYKISVLILSDKYVDLLSCNNPDLYDKLALQQCVPYTCDVQSILNMCTNLFEEHSRFNFVAQTLDQEFIPCEIESHRQGLSTCEISPGIYLQDICVIYKYYINPKLLQALAQSRSKDVNKYIFIDHEHRQNQISQFKQKFYSNTFNNKQLPPK